MASKRKFKRDYIILEAKDMNFRHKERILPKAFAKVEINEEKSIVSLYVENLKFIKDGYRVVAIQSDYETLDLGKVILSEQGKGEFVLDLEDNDVDIKGIALLHEKSIPLVGFKGSKIENYEEILFTGCQEDEEYEEIEYIEVDDEEYDDDDYEEECEEDDNYEDDDEFIESYEEIDEEIEYVEVEDDDYEEDNFQEDDDYEEECDRVQVQEYEPVEQNCLNKNKNTTPKQTKHKKENKYENCKIPNPLLMPRQIKKGLKSFREVKPFICDYIENTRWWKIDINPVTLCGYTMPHLGYVNTLNYTMYSDAVTQSYKYRHYLFGVQYDEYNKRKYYIYGIPGSKTEQPDKGHTGFRKYQPCDSRNDNLGYWLCIIDSRTRKILK